MLDDKAQLTVGMPIHPKVVGWGGVKASQIVPLSPGKTADIGLHIVKMFSWVQWQHFTFLAFYNIWHNYGTVKVREGL